MLNPFKILLNKNQQEARDRSIDQLKVQYQSYSDPWGFDINAIEQALSVTLPLYKNYFKVRVFGQEHIQQEPYMLVSNHTGQIPIDAALISTAFAIDIVPPRVLHSMIERFMANLPFIGEFSARAGSVLGDRDNCKWLIENGESILVFPEGVRGISKETPRFYELQQFSNGFYRIALETKTKILPVCVIGAEEMFPYVMNLKSVAKKIGLPSLPITPNLIPLPSPIDIHIGKPIDISDILSPEAKAEDIRKEVENVEMIIENMIQKGLTARRPYIGKDLPSWLKKKLL